MCLLPLYSSLCVSVVSLSIAVFRLEVPMAFSSDISNYLSTYITMTLFLYLTSYYSYLFHMCFTSLPPTIQGRSAALVSLSSDRCLVACPRLSPSRVCIFRWVRRQALSLGLPTYLLHTFIHTYIHTYIHYIHAYVATIPYEVCGICYCGCWSQCLCYCWCWCISSLKSVSLLVEVSACIYVCIYVCMRSLLLFGVHVSMYVYSYVFVGKRGL